MYRLPRRAGSATKTKLLGCHKKTHVYYALSGVNSALVSRQASLSLPPSLSRPPPLSTGALELLAAGTEELVAQLLARAEFPPARCDGGKALCNWPQAIGGDDADRFVEAGEFVHYERSLRPRVSVARQQKISPSLFLTIADFAAEAHRSQRRVLQAPGDRLDRRLALRTHGVRCVGM